MERCRCEAILLGGGDYRESDRLVTLLTLEQGKLRGIARGAKRSLKRFGGTLETFARLRVEIEVKSGLSRLLGADAVTIFPGIRGDLRKIGAAGYACEAVDHLLPEALPNPRLFRLLAAYLERLDLFPPSPSDRRFFEINFLNILGYRPALEQCGSCGTDLSLLPGCRAGNGGDLLCAGCGRGGRPISTATVNLLKGALRTGRFGVIEFSPEGLAEAGHILDPAMAAHTGRPLKSLAFLRELGE